MSSLAAEIRVLVERGASGELSIRELDRALSPFVRRIAAARDDEEARRLYGRARSLASERGYGHRTEAEARDELQALLLERVAEKPV